MFRTAKPFPFILQTGMMECGPACLAMIFKYYGYFNIQPLLSKLTEVSTSGVNLFSMAEVAQQFGFVADAYEMEYEYLSKIKLPCIAHYKGIHFIVIYRVTDTHVYIADPAYGKDKLTKEDFLKKWNGIVLTVEPTPDIFKNKDLEESVRAFQQSQKGIFSVFYRPVLLALRKVIGQVLLASALLQLLGLALPFFTQTIVDYALVNQNRQLLMVILLGMVLVFVVQVFVLYIRNILLVHLRVHFEMEFFSRFFRHFISLHQKYYDSNRREDFMVRFQENITIRQLVNPTVIESVVDLLFILFYVPILIGYNPKLGLMALVFVGVYAVVTLAATPRVRRLAYKVFYENLSTLGEFLDTLLGMQSVKLLAIENVKFWQWKNKFKRTLNVVMEAEKQSIVLHSLQRSVYYLSQLAIFWLGAVMTFQHEITIGQYLALTSIFLIVLNALNNLSMVWYNLTELSVSLTRLNDVLLQETENSRLTDTISEFQTLPLTLENVYFKYSPSQEHFILNNVNVQLQAGQHIGIVGRNGSGKSTLVKLLVGLYGQYEGRILFGKVDMKLINPVALRKKVFLFPQDIYVFNGTIRENIQYANPNASMDDIIQAAQMADLHEFVKTQYLGYNYKIGDMGANLSGGQKLKIGFARLFLANPDLIILDEASSMLDVESEKRIMANVKSHFRDKTIISIAHRMQTLKTADMIWVIDGGSITEQGNHQTLIANEQGLYYQFMKTYIDY